MAQYKLIYFNARGRAEIARQLFVLGAQPYDDSRITEAEWQKLKPEVPFEQLPVLEVNGEQIPQSYAICRFLARQFGHAGRTPFEEALVDSVADQIKDYMNEIKPFVDVLMGTAAGDVDPATSGFLVGETLTWADLLLAEHCAVFGEKFPDFLEGYPEIKTHEEKVHSHPGLKNWIHTRPKTKF